MANALYTKAKEALISAGIDWVNDDIRMILVDTGAYTLNIATHAFLSDIPAGARIKVSGSITGKAKTAGAATCAAVLFPAVSGVSIECVAVYKHTGVEGTSQLIAFLDTVTGLPLTPSGADITLTFSNYVFTL